MGDDKMVVQARRKRKGTKDERLKRSQILLEVTRRCASLSNIQDVWKELVSMTSRELDCDRGTLFLNDDETNELFSYVAQGDLVREIRILNDSGIAGHVFQSGEARISDDPYSDELFNRSVDQRTGYTTRNIACVPVRTMSGETIGVMQSLNKRVGEFNDDDLELLEEMTTQAAVVLQGLQHYEQIDKIREKENAFLKLMSDINSEFELSRMLMRVVQEITEMLASERATIFMYDQSTATLFSRVAAGGEINEIRFPSHLGIAGEVFTTGKSMNIPYAYADLRFNPAFDKQTGFFTRSILCVPIINTDNNVIGVTQVLNKKGGTFSDEDEQRLKAFTAQISISLQNSKLFDDVQRIKNYNESMLQSMSNGVITMDPKGLVVTCNSAALRIWELNETDIVGHNVADLVGPDGQWVIEQIEKAKAEESTQTIADTALTLNETEKTVNLTFMPLIAAEEDKELGSMMVFEDISSEKRMKSTMSRYMDPVIAAQMLEGDAHEVLGGINAEATVMFTDVRGFTTITEEYGAQGTVSFLNDYFSLMVDCITKEGGMLDKFIGDAIMACFGLPMSHEDDPDRAVRASIEMIKTLWRWNQDRLSKGLKVVDMGIGLNTDTVVSGNIGSPKRMDYTLIGDGVNLAARLESACKSYFARILVSESTVQKLKGTYRLRAVDLVVVKGKTQPVKVFEILDYHDEDSFPNLMDVVNHFNDGMNAYQAANWDKAIERFNQCLKFNPEDHLSQSYVERCEALKADPPKGEWDGVWVMKTK
ncbi:MAG: GAF domain-containing protein [Betaproteobacteria bacterium]